MGKFYFHKARKGLFVPAELFRLLRKGERLGNLPNITRVEILAENEYLVSAVDGTSRRYAGDTRVHNILLGEVTEAEEAKAKKAAASVANATNATSTTTAHRRPRW